jgi:hypothetical protein
LEMRAHSNETDYDVVGWIVLDEDVDEPIRDIYEDPRITVTCGSNWLLYGTQHVPKDEIPSGKYFNGDWHGCNKLHY